ncbi:hypothetical protein [Meiothermus granaticius]|uniref:Tetratricopeptide repeat protein n=1 Tax=Meiothermus granaticius NBRC 107808 TaxID=1227551 RepID=A0A399F664_9DEIN|nr:hypothetical protein [Meiothermus granaticius]MCL6525921.1 hypothetical protein [Thermaceae bacterium]RIH91570.1 hypothetical protein Mgrana_02510 [Meiothermus granaticius NBRC 107808]GEM85445.1 hypothetical protein MGR01S_00700 [Meiothermus granaticius NBRC 107808]
MLLLPTLGPFHLLHPRYNAVSVLEYVRQQAPQQVWLASYGPEELAAGTWRDEGELPLFHLLPWAQAARVPVEALDSRAYLKAEADRFRQALSQFPKGQEILASAAGLEERLQSLLTTPQSPQTLWSPAILAELQAYLTDYRERFGEGPATGFRQERMQALASQLRDRQPTEPVVILADLLDYALLRGLLPEAQTPEPQAPSPAERQRSVLDRAWRLEASDDWGALLAQLAEVGSPEAQYCAAQIYLAAGQPGDALELLEELIHSEFSFPEYLPGYVLARYGQLADLSNQRDKALRAYQAVLALAWAPREAQEIALAGQRAPFKVS